MKENGYRDFNYVSLRDGTSSHAWLENADLVVDITGDQFGPPVPPVYVGDKKEYPLATKFHEISVSSTDYAVYDLATRSRLDALYRILTAAMDDMNSTFTDPTA